MGSFPETLILLDVGLTESWGESKKASKGEELGRVKKSFQERGVGAIKKLPRERLILSFPDAFMMLADQCTSRSRLR